MLTPHKRDTMHRVWLLRLLTEIADDSFLVRSLLFKGGTCAALRGLLNRFSVDLDFDLAAQKEIPLVRLHLEKIFQHLQLTIKEQSKKVPQYFLHYTSARGERSSIALDVTVPPPKANEYESVYFSDVDRFLQCQTVTTMVANKLVTPLDRFQRHHSIAGRDIYDIHHFLLNGLGWNAAIIEERTGKTILDFLHSLHTFIRTHVTQTIIDQDLNTLLPLDEFHLIRTKLKQETLSILEQHL